MAEFKKRETAYKLRIGEILSGAPIVEDVPQEASPDPTQNISSGATKERFRFLELGDKKIIRVNIIANIIEKYISEGEKKYASITVDDATGQIRLKTFGEDVNKFSDLAQGDTIIIIGVLRTYNRDLYILPEVIKKADPRYLLIRKLELEKRSSPRSASLVSGAINTEKKLGVREEIIEMIKGGGDSSGVGTEDIILKVKSASPEIINAEIIKLLEDGMIYEPRPGKVRWLG
jgi:RPA family protein